VDIGIDLGGTKIEIICLDDSYQERYRRRISSPQNSYNDTLSSIKVLVDEAESYLNIKARVGLGIPGSICKTSQTVKNSNSTWINGRPLLKDLCLALQRDVRVENDANCFALSEYVDGAAAKYSSVFGVIIGTGCGGGIVIDGKILTGVNGLGGEWGHNPLPFPRLFMTDQYALHNYFDQFGKVEQSSIYRDKQAINYIANTIDENEYPGPYCYCGKRGCLETWISGKGFEMDYKRLTGLSESAESIISLANDGDVFAVKCLNRYSERLAKSLAQVINIIDPEIIVLGGGMSNVEYLYTEVPKYLDKYVFSDKFNSPIVKALHGDASGVRGAAFLQSVL
jgi:predicted NBD/HSP70 family sugar kinase